MGLEASPGASAELAPSGKLRVGLNYGNFLLVLKDAPDGTPRGIAPDLGRELGKRLGVPVEFVRFDAAGKLAASHHRRCRSRRRAHLGGREERLRPLSQPHAQAGETPACTGNRRLI